jgi:peptide/nickel transport system permease protein
MALQGPRAYTRLLTTSGKVGLLFLAVIVALSLYVVATYPLDFGVKRWNNPVVWADNPKLAPPAWTNYLTPVKRVEHTVLRAEGPSAVEARGGVVHHLYRFTIDFEFDEPPSFTTLNIRDLVYHKAPPIITVALKRPDGATIRLYETLVPGPTAGEAPPFVRFREAPLRIQLSGEEGVAQRVASFIRREFQVSVRARDLLIRGVDRALFGVPEGEGFRVVRGTYTLEVDVAFTDSRDRVSEVSWVVGGQVYGLLGTDSLGRDLAVGLLFGFPVALLIGVASSTLVTAIGSLLGVASGYLGGKADMAIQRVADVLSNVPLLPLLIFLTFILGQKLWVVILILIAFSWPGLTITVRSMVLQVRESQFVEAATALGASRLHIILRHILPQVAPFVLAQMIFFTPSAILAEAALSFLGLGDPSIPTWGQILEQGFRSGGVYVGYWWWVLPPGLLIVFTALTFVLIALGLEAIINPRLRVV